LALTGLISPPPPLAGVPAADIAAYYTRHQAGLEVESAADGIGAMLLVVFAPSGILAAGGLPDIVSFASLLAWLVACSLVMLARRAPVESSAA
jgi:hypothetical protein